MTNTPRLPTQSTESTGSTEAQFMLADMRRKYRHALEKGRDKNWLAGEPITARILEHWIPIVERLVEVEWMYNELQD